MSNVFAQASFGVLVVLLFVAALLLIESLYFLWRGWRGPQARRLSRRMQALADYRAGVASVHVLKEASLSRLPLFERWLAGNRLAGRLHTFVQQADVRPTLSQLLLASLVLAVGGGAALMRVHGEAAIALGTAVALGAAPWLYVAFRRERRLRTIERQLPDALDFLTRALRSGQGFIAALLMAGDELPEPIATELRAVHDEITFGVALERALANMADRVPITDLRYFVVSVLIQRESGGNLTEVLANLSRLIRERYKLLAKIRVLSANGRFSGWILAVAPFALAAVMNLANHEFMSLLWRDPMGISIMKVLGVMMIVGILIMRRIVRIRV
jgi:tight adherence protein B